MKNLKGILTALLICTMLVGGIGWVRINTNNSDINSGTIVGLGTFSTNGDDVRPTGH